MSLDEVRFSLRIERGQLFADITCECGQELYVECDSITTKSDLVEWIKEELENNEWVDGECPNCSQEVAA